MIYFSAGFIVIWWFEWQLSNCVPDRGLTYKDSGVDIAAGNRLVVMIKPLAKATSRPGKRAE